MNSKVKLRKFPRKQTKGRKEREMNVKQKRKDKKLRRPI